MGGGGGEGGYPCAVRSNWHKREAPHFLIFRCQQANALEVGAGDEGQGQICFFLCTFPQALLLPRMLSFFFIQLVSIQYIISF